jgi:hypothetical protein
LKTSSTYEFHGSKFNNVPTMILKYTIDDGYQLSDGSTRKPRGTIQGNNSKSLYLPGNKEGQGLVKLLLYRTAFAVALPFEWWKVSNVVCWASIHHKTMCSAEESVHGWLDRKYFEN